MPLGTVDDSAAAAARTPLERGAIRKVVEEELNATKFVDVHTHLFMPSLGDLGLWGIDDLVTYHYLEAELFRSSKVTPEQYWAMPKREKADAIWRALFVENTPVSESTRGVVAVLKAFGLNPAAPDLAEAREFFTAQKVEPHIRRVLDLAGVSEVVMTNDPLDPNEAPQWVAGAARDPQFLPVLRLDRILNRWAAHWEGLANAGYDVNEHAFGRSVAEVRRFLAEWCKRMQPVYMAVSLPDTFRYPEPSVRGRLLAQAILPSCRELNIPLSLMIGVRYQVNPALRLAGDAVGGRRSAVARAPVRRVPREPLPGQRAQPRESARTVCLREEVQ